MTHAAIIVIGLVVAVRAAGFYWTEGVDFHAYWSLDLTHPYDGARSYGPNAFLYSPLFAQLTEPLRWLPFQLALALWTALGLGCLVYLAGPWTLPAMVLLSSEWVNGNVHLVMAAAVVLSFRQAGLWVVPTMTKLGPGIGLVWHALRGEWRYVARALGVMVVAFGVSFILAPDLWFGWVQLLRDNAGAMPPPGSMQVPLVLRLGVAAGLLVWGRQRPWVVPLAVAFGLPVLWWAGLIVFSLAAWKVTLSVSSQRAPEPTGSQHRDS